MLHVDIATLNAIGDDANGMDRHLYKVLQEWLQTGKDETWKTLSEAHRHRTVACPDVGFIFCMCNIFAQSHLLF